VPPRFTYWTIILEGAPTAFRARDRADLVPTLKQLQARHPDTVLKWFARGRLWTSPDEARLASKVRKPRPPRDWRPGGEHRDPRARFARGGRRKQGGPRKRRG
jgi:hypothetical protein